MDTRRQTHGVHDEFDSSKADKWLPDGPTLAAHGTAVACLTGDCSKADRDQPEACASKRRATALPASWMGHGFRQPAGGREKALASGPGAPDAADPHVPWLCGRG